MIELEALSKILPSAGRPLTILHPLDLAVPAGQFLAVMGPSGSGKSTLLGLMAGLEEPAVGGTAGSRVERDRSEDHMRSNNSLQ